MLCRKRYLGKDIVRMKNINRKIKIRKLAGNEDLQLVKHGFDKLAVYYGRKAAEVGYSIFIAEDEGQVVGILAADKMGEKVGLIKYIFVTVGRRSNGIGRMLLNKAVTLFWESGSRSVCMEFIVAKTQWMKDLACSEGFEIIKESFSVINTSNYENRALFRRYMETIGCKLEKFMLKRGFKIKAFNYASEQEIYLLKEQIGYGYPQYLDPFAMERKRIDEGSFLVLKNGKVVGYLALGKISGPEMAVEISCRACLKEYENTGVGVWPLLKALEYIVTVPQEIKKVIFNIDAADKKLTNMMGKMPVSFPGSFSSKLTTFRKNKGDDS